MSAYPPAAVRPLPEPLARLAVHALDLHWSWNHAGDELWKQLDSVLWERTRNPWLLLQYVSQARLERLADDDEFLGLLEALDESHARYHAAPPWRPPGAASVPRVAYFSMEFGLDEALPLYAGGLGVLAGDFLKTASDLGLPVVGVGILWQQGYFRQLIDAAGSQTELYPFNDPASLPVQPVIGADGARLRVELSLPGRVLRLRAWQVVVGRTMLYLLDSNDPLNAAPDRGLTGTLYGGGPEIRLMQEIVLGIGGWRLLEAVGALPEICHLNEGHAAFVVVERARGYMERHGVRFHEALWATRAGNVFTTHTAVPAGFDTFSIADFDRQRLYFEQYVRRLGVPWADVLSLGRQHPADDREPFNMAWLAVRGCAWVNAVSRLHGAVSRRLFAGLFPRRPEPEVPIGYITNGVHMPSWDSPWTDALWTSASGKARWRGDVSALTSDMARMPNEDLWKVRNAERQDLVRYARERLARKLARHDETAAAVEAADRVLRPDVLTIGFARRFASYKRPNLLLHDPDRLLRLLVRSGMPVQLIVAGKAHPRDVQAKALVEQWVRFAARPSARASVVFLEDYDMRLAMELVQGVDVWVNTPRRPWEACGTSGMKVLVNGGLNLSSLDGWWAEAFAPEVGWAVGVGPAPNDEEADRRDADALYRMLEADIVPCFYDRDTAGLPRRWLARMRASMATLTPRFSSVRMLQEYVTGAYVPGARELAERTADGTRLGIDLARWARRLAEHWSAIRFGPVTSHTDAGALTVSVPIFLGAIAPDDVRVELYADPAGESPGAVCEMMRVAGAVPDDEAQHYSVTVRTSRPERDFTPRVVPFHPAAELPLELPLIAWAK
ncbi:MAG: alpha-glucan family phosphorylase [Acidobacteria bacterium]|nr:alpha-glucan family phosphorylase [Acidobacteriota bacterium]